MAASERVHAVLRSSQCYISLQACKFTSINIPRASISPPNIKIYCLVFAWLLCLLHYTEAWHPFTFANNHIHSEIICNKWSELKFDYIINNRKLALATKINFIASINTLLIRRGWPSLFSASGVRMNSILLPTTARDNNRNMQCREELLHTHTRWCRWEYKISNEN